MLAHITTCRRGGAGAGPAAEHGAGDGRAEQHRQGGAPHTLQEVRRGGGHRGPGQWGHREVVREAHWLHCQDDSSIIIKYKRGRSAKAAITEGVNEYVPNICF